jgi:isopentenyl-diphosphate delta-isomerase type 1
MPGAWDLPGGGLNPNESSEEGIIREVREETGMETVVVRSLGSRSYLQNPHSGKHDKTMIVFLLRVAGGLNIHLSSEHDAFRWVVESDLDGVFSPNDLMGSVIREYFEPEGTKSVEYFDVIDEHDNVKDTKPGKECVKLGLLHRAVVIFLFDYNGMVYIQKRANNLPFYPGYWSASCTGHVSAGESYLEAARRETKEELGIKPEPIEVGKFISPKWEATHGVEWESIVVFEAVSRDANIVLSDESQEGKYISVEEFQRLLNANPPVLTPDTILSARYSSRLQ